MAPPIVDPNDVLMTGENSFIRLSHDGGKTLASRFSHWRVLWCAAGSGHALFVQSDLTDGKARVYSDNPAVARWLQTSIERYLFPAFADTNLPVIGAAFARSGGARSTALETVDSSSDHFRLSWWDTPHAVHHHGRARRGRSAHRRVQHVLPGPLGPGRAERPLRHRPGLGREARRPGLHQRLSRVVGVVGEATRLTHA